MVTSIPNTYIEEIARAWASIDGKAKWFDDCKANAGLDETDGYYGGYIAEAEELLRRCPSVSTALTRQVSETFTREQMLAEVERRVERALAARSSFVDAMRHENSHIENMARAMCERDGADWNAVDCNHTANGEEPEEQRDYWRDKADAALSALQMKQGFFANLTPEQQGKALTYRGPENFGSDEFIKETP